MAPLLICIGVALLLLLGATLGRIVRDRLPGGELPDEMKDLVRVAIGFLATLAALVLGLLISSAKDTFDARIEEVQRAATKIILLDQELRRLGPAGATARASLKQILTTGEGAESLIDPRAIARPAGADSVDEAGKLQDAVRAIKPENEAQALARSKSIQLIEELAQMRWELAAHASSKIPPLALGVLVAWCVAIAAGLNLFAPRNHMMRAVSAIIALSIASALFLVLEMDQPFGGFIAVSDAPLRAAVQIQQR